MNIFPTVGRVVWFYSFSPVQRPGHRGPLAAHVCKVHSASLVNLLVIGEDGFSFPALSVRLVQEDEEVPMTDYCCWMPFQTQVAKERAAAASK